MSWNEIMFEGEKNVNQGTLWTPWHDRLHRHLLQRSDLLPQGITLVVAVSGGQDSIATLGLLKGLISLHKWTIVVWHGNHQWHSSSTQISRELKEWCSKIGLKIVISRATKDLKHNEAAARKWRYEQLEKIASKFNADVVTGHTSSDRAETVLIQLARGTDLKGLSTLREQRALNENQSIDCKLRRPMLLFDRSETYQICRDLKLPIWIDPSNADKTITRNRIRHDILPILEEIYPGCSRRMATMAERLSTTEQSLQELVNLYLENEQESNKPLLETLRTATPATRNILIKNWLKHQGINNINSSQINQLSHRLCHTRDPGSQHFADGWRVHWKQSNLYATQQTQTNNKEPRR